MAGNDTSARIAAQNAYNDARRAGVTGSDLATLKAAMDAAQARENSSTNTNYVTPGR